MARETLVVPCPLCGSERHMKKPKKLYGHAVCKKCVNAFANRRQFAYIVDVLLFYLGGILLTAGWLFLLILLYPAIPPDEQPTWIAMVLAMALFLSKDGLAGRSPGKMLLGVQVVKTNTGRPCGVGGSMARNVWLFVPLVPLLIMIQMMRGPRLGDSLAKTKVIWDRYAGHPVFYAGAGPVPDSQEAATLAAIQAAIEAAPPPVEESHNPFQSPRV